MFLNLGAGNQEPIDGWEAVDIDPQHPAIHMGDVTAPASTGDGLPFATYSMSGIACHHVLDLFDDDDLRQALAECRRVLIPDGVLRVSLINPLVGFARYVEGDHNWLYRKVPGAHGPDDALCRWLTWHGTRRQLFTPESFRATVRLQGWCSATPLFGLDAFDSRADESFFVNLTWSEPF